LVGHTLPTRFYDDRQTPFKPFDEKVKSTTTAMVMPYDQAGLGVVSSAGRFWNHGFHQLTWIEPNQQNV
jgi:hypothetical protein